MRVVQMSGDADPTTVIHELRNELRRGSEHGADISGRSPANCGGRSGIEITSRGHQIPSASSPTMIAQCWSKPPSPDFEPLARVPYPLVSFASSAMRGKLPQEAP
jgi:hypothetical protein